MESTCALAVVGATGLVGQEILAALEQRHFPIGSLRLYASLRSAGEEIRCGTHRARVELLDNARLEDAQIVFMAAGERVSATWSERAARAGAVVIDTSSLFAGDSEVPLVVPEVNGAALADFAQRNIVASPDSPAIALAVLLDPLHAAATITRVVATTFEPVSGAGAGGVEELHQQTLSLMSGQGAEHTVFPRRIAFNVVPQVGDIVAGGASRGETQTASALRRLLDAPHLVVGVTRVQVPMFYGSALAVNIETETRLEAAEARAILRAARGVVLAEEVAEDVPYATAADSVGEDAVFVGRIREDPVAPVLDFWGSLDNTRKGAAVNAVQIAELLVRDHL